MKQERIRLIQKGKKKEGPVLYWMSRDQRIYDNWACVFASELSRRVQQPYAVVFVLAKSFPGAALRHYDFMLSGLREVAVHCERKNIPFYLLRGDPVAEIPKFVRKYKIGTLITDFDPLRIKRAWLEKVTAEVTVPVYQVDAHNIVPCWHASPKQEYAAYTIRPKIHRVLHEYLDDFPTIRKQRRSWPRSVPKIEWDRLLSKVEINRRVKPVTAFSPGFRTAKKRLGQFLSARLSAYDEERNDPNQNGQSGLSPYLHFGQIAPQRVAIEVARTRVPSSVKDAFLEELIVRRELSDNFCFYNQDYDRVRSFPVWAQNTLEKHWQDRREYIYRRDTFEKAETHDPLWNAAQRQMAETGKMHGFMRMYWAKKILEWSRDPEEALATAIYLNDTYELDGRDPNGYTGIAWSIGGVHDRAWNERDIFGKVRYMSFNGCKSKFDVKAYVGRWEL